MSDISKLFGNGGGKTGVERAMREDKKLIIQVLCEKCGHPTNHKVIADHAISADPGSDYLWWITYQIIKCCGCDTVSFREEIVTEEDFDPYTGEPEPSETLYPPRISGRRPLETIDELPPNIQRTYREGLIALNNSCPILTAIGLRTLIEAICIDQKAQGKNLEGKIDALATQGVLSVKQAQILHSHRFLGNIAAHEIHAPDPKELVAALDIAETLLKTIYILPKLEKSISSGKKKQPRRKKPKKP